MKVLVYEYVTGGGLVGHSLPESWAREGSAMRRAIASDFASVPGIVVVMPLDCQFPIEELPGVIVRVVEDRTGCQVESLVEGVDLALLIAPESDGILGHLTAELERLGIRCLGSSLRAVELTADKARLAEHFKSRSIPTPETRVIRCPDPRLPEDWQGSIVVKPRWGAGSIETRVVRDQRCPDWVLFDQTAIAQTYHPGQPMSASFLVDEGGGLTLLGVGCQRIAFDSEGRISYEGGIILPSIHSAPQAVEDAIRSVNQADPLRCLRGFMGVDYLDDPERGITVIEINPRPTTSYVALAKLLGPGTIAGAWLDAMSGRLDRTDWPERIRHARQGPALTFLADGSFVSQDLD